LGRFFEFFKAHVKGILKEYTYTLPLPTGSKFLKGGAAPTLD
jgi:hypothetical protein